MLIAVDLDGMLLAFPDYFKFFFKAYQAQGAKVGILTSRPSSEKDDLDKALDEVGIHADFIVTMPDDLRDSEFPVGIYKAIACNELGIDVLYDDFQSDDNTMMGDFFSHNQKTKPFTSFAYNPDPPKEPKK